MLWKSADGQPEWQAGSRHGWDSGFFWNVHVWAMEEGFTFKDERMKCVNQLSLTTICMSCYLAFFLSRTCITITLMNITIIRDSHARNITPLQMCPNVQHDLIQIHIPTHAIQLNGNRQYSWYVVHFICAFHFDTDYKMQRPTKHNQYIDIHSISNAKR